MSMAWETTIDDVRVVLDAYGIEWTEQMLQEIHDELDHDDIESGVLYFDTIEVQTDAMLSDIEDHLMESGVIPRGDKQFVANEEDDVLDDEDDEDDED